MLVEFARQCRVDPCRDELLGSVLFRVLEYSLDFVLRDPDLVDLVRVEQGLKLAVGNDRVLLARLVKALQQRERHEGRDDVPDVDLCLQVSIS